MKPVYFVLKKKWFAEFAAGRKTTEWRRHSRQYRLDKLFPGRRVILSEGYTDSMLEGHIVAAQIVEARDAPPEVIKLFIPRNARCLIGTKPNSWQLKSS